MHQGSGKDKLAGMTNIEMRIKSDAMSAVNSLLSHTRNILELIMKKKKIKTYFPFFLTIGGHYSKSTTNMKCKRARSQLKLELSWLGMPKKIQCDCILFTGQERSMFGKGRGIKLTPSSAV